MMDTARLRQLSRLFEEAEQRIALAQCRADCEIPVRCVEEKSRASHHLFRYAASNAKADADEVVRCCERAIFDACEFEILSYSRKFMRFQERYRTVPISMVVPDYLSWRTAHQNARELIAAYALKEHRHTVHDNCLAQAEVIHAINMRLPFAAQELDKHLEKINTEHRNHRRISRLHWIGIIVGILGVIAAGLAWSFPDLIKDFIHSREQSTSHTTQPRPASQPSSSPKPPH